MSRVRHKTQTTQHAINSTDTSVYTEVKVTFSYYPMTVTRYSFVVGGLAKVTTTVSSLKATGVTTE